MREREQRSEARIAEANDDKKDGSAVFVRACTYAGDDDARLHRREGCGRGDGCRRGEHRRLSEVIGRTTVTTYTRPLRELAGQGDKEQRSSRQDCKQGAHRPSAQRSVPTPRSSQVVKRTGHLLISERAREKVRQEPPRPHEDRALDAPTPLVVRTSRRALCWAVRWGR